MYTSFLVTWETVKPSMRSRISWISVYVHLKRVCLQRPVGHTYMCHRIQMLDTLIRVTVYRCWTHFYFPQCFLHMLSESLSSLYGKYYNKLLSLQALERVIKLARQYRIKMKFSSLTSQTQKFLSLKEIMESYRY